MDAKTVGGLFTLAMNMPKDSEVAKAMDALVDAVKADYRADGKVGHAVSRMCAALSNPKDAAFTKLGMVERMAVTMLGSNGRRWLEKGK